MEPVLVVRVRAWYVTYPTTALDSQDGRCGAAAVVFTRRRVTLDCGVYNFDDFGLDSSTNEAQRRPIMPDGAADGHLTA